MLAEKKDITVFLELAKLHPVIDVRSPGEFAHAHIPGAYNLPLFTDEERKQVGTAYKQESRETAIKIGLDYFGVKMRKMVEEMETFTKASKEQTLLIHCWRGGMRSAAIAWLMNLYGFKVYTLAGGYKAYRKWVMEQFEKEYPFHIVGGYTGSAKTLVMQELARQSSVMIDLEGIAKHKGSAFGALGEGLQPSQEMFENLLATALINASQQCRSANGEAPIWLEDESQRIGLVNIPQPLWKTIRNSPVYFLDIPFEERLNYIVEGYGKFDREKLIGAIIRIQKRLGGLETKTAVGCMVEGDIKESFRILLKYYDKYYLKGLHSRDQLDQLLHTIPRPTIDPKVNAIHLLNHSRT
jgi:tRNA 2-selenouridine synthase